MLGIIETVQLVSNEQIYFSARRETVAVVPACTFADRVLRTRRQTDGDRAG